MPDEKPKPLTKQEMKSGLYRMYGKKPILLSRCYGKT